MESGGIVGFQLERLGLVLAVIGLVLVVIGAWRLFRIDPLSDRYAVKGLRAPGDVGNLVRDQRGPTLFVLIGSAVQVVAAVMTIVGNLT